MLHIDRRGPVVRLVLDRPEVRNALNDELIARLRDAFERLASDTRAVVISGSGKAFCAGGDLAWMRKAAGYSPEENARDALALAELFDAILHCPAVVVVAAHGAVFGGGCGLVAAADVAIAAQGTIFAFSEVRLGLVPATISTFVIPKIGRGHARALFSTGETFDVERALRIGLVHETCAPDAIEEAVNGKLCQILAVGPRAAARAKRLAQESTLAKEEAARLLAEMRAGEEGREGVAAFLERRPARYVVELDP